MKVDIISRETVKPSSPTPPHLRSFKLSLLDQVNLPTYSPLVFFYPIISKPGRIQTAKRSYQLKKSLSETLSRYYPFAGRLKNGFSSIDCNDDGADYVEAHVNCELSKFLRKPDIEELHRFLPCDSVITEPDHSLVQLAIQVNNFDCGGIAIGICFLHIIIDASSLTAFVKDWAAINARGSTEGASHPIFLQDSLYPSRDLSGLLSNVNFESSNKEELMITTRKGRFVFTGSSMAALKANVSSNMSSSSSSSTAKRPTRVEVVSSIICQRIMAACRELKPGSRSLPFVARHAINIRGRLVPPLPENTIGNMVWATTVSLRNESESELVDLVLQLREANREINSEHLREFQGEEGISRFLEKVEEVEQIYSEEKVDSCFFSSVCRLPFYETDFGWGKPAWVSFFNEAVAGIHNIVVLMDTVQGDGVEAWVTLDERIMAVLERDKRLLTFASVNPSIDDIVFNISSL